MIILARMYLAFTSIILMVVSLTSHEESPRARHAVAMTTLMAVCSLIVLVHG